MMRILSRRVALAALVLCTAAGLSAGGCDRDSSSSAAKSAGTTRPANPQSDAAARARGKVFTFINRGDIITLDLNQMSYLQDFRITYALREGLYKPDPQTLEPKLALAEEANVSDDKRVWTFKIRKDAKWSNGDPVTAKDFVFSWRNLLESPGQYSYLLDYIHGAKAYGDAYREGKPASFDVVGIKASDDYTLVVTLDEPLVFFDDLLTFPTLYPRNERSMEPFKLTDSKGRVSYDPKYTQAQNVVTNGPYLLKSWTPGAEVALVPNPAYREHDRIKLDGIRMIVNNDPQSAFQQYENGEVDWMADVNAEIGFKLKQQGRSDLRVSDAFGTAYLTVNCGEKVPELGDVKNPLSDIRVRQALAMTIDKQTIVKNITRMGEKPADRFIPAHFYKDWTSKQAPGVDVAKAKQLLADAGYPDGKGFPTLSICYNADSFTRRDVAGYLRNQWQKQLGVNIELRAMELKGYRDYTTNKKYTLAMAAWYGDYQDPSTWTDKYLSTSENNDSNWAPPEYDPLLFNAKKETDVEKRKQLLMTAEGMINEQLPVIPIYYYVNFFLVRDEVRNLPLNSRNTTIWDDVSLDR